jgi:hypothetical protein
VFAGNKHFSVSLIFGIKAVDYTLNAMTLSIILLTIATVRTITLKINHIRIANRTLGV